MPDDNPYDFQLSNSTGAGKGTLAEMSNLSRLPEIAAAVQPETGQIVVITRGYRGCSAVVNPMPVDELNKQFGATKQQAAAMLGGALHGWGSDAANIDNYDAEGKRK